MYSIIFGFNYYGYYFSFFVVLLNNSRINDWLFVCGLQDLPLLFFPLLLHIPLTNPISSTIHSMDYTTSWFQYLFRDFKIEGMAGVMYNGIGYSIRTWSIAYHPTHRRLIITHHSSLAMVIFYFLTSTSTTVLPPYFYFFSNLIWTTTESAAWRF